jgi:hypothetical protein
LRTKDFLSHHTLPEQAHPTPPDTPTTIDLLFQVEVANAQSLV